MNAPNVMNVPRTARRRQIKHRTREALSGYMFVIVWIVGFAIFTLWPLAQTLYFSVNQVTISATGINLEYIQWQNYTRALSPIPLLYSCSSNTPSKRWFPFPSFSSFR